MGKIKVQSACRAKPEVSSKLRLLKIMELRAGRKITILPQLATCNFCAFKKSKREKLAQRQYIYNFLIIQYQEKNLVQQSFFVLYLIWLLAARSLLLTARRQRWCQSQRMTGIKRSLVSIQFRYFTVPFWIPQTLHEDLPGAGVVSLCRAEITTPGT